MALTIHWYKKFDEQDFAGSDQDPIAYLQRSENVLEKRPPKRLLWKTIETGTPLYQGDAIRTGAISSGSVKLVKSGTLIEVEPDSLIVLEESNSGVELDLISGSLFVEKTASKKSKEKAPTIKSGNTKITLNKDAALSLSKTEKGETNVAVTKGVVDLSAGNKKLKIEEGKTGTLKKDGFDRKGVIDIISPKANAKIDLAKATRVSFRWKPLPKDVRVTLQVGSTRKTLTTKASGIGGASGKASASISAGNFYWRLQGFRNGQVVFESLTQKATGVFFAVPQLVAPKGNESIPISKKNATFSWTMPEHTASMSLQISKSSKFKKNLVQRRVSDISELDIKLPKPGTYFWRVIAYWTDKSIRPKASRANSFKVEKLKNLKAPIAIAPKGNRKFVFNQVRSGIFLEWNEVNGANRYHIRAKIGKEKILDTKIEDTQIRLKIKSIGNLNWTVRALADNGQRSKWSRNASSKIIAAASIAWLNKFGSTYFYQSKKPSIELRWQQGPKQVRNYRIRYKKDSDNLLGAKWRKVSRNLIKLAHVSDGDYYYQVQGLDRKGAVVGETPVTQIKIAPNPTLAAPRLAFAPGTTLKANRSGDLKINWKRVDGAKSYAVSLENLKSGKRDLITSKSTNLKLKSLRPGTYRIKVGSYNSRNDLGPFGEEFFVKVPKVSNIPAPNLKKVDLKVH